MQIVIEIDDEIYDYITKEYTCMRVKDGHAVAVAIANGTPLPEGHGDLKDINAFIAKVQADRQHAIYTRSWTADDVLDALSGSYTPTIIEADGGTDAESI